MARISNQCSLISVDPRFVNQIPAARSYSWFNAGDGADDGDIFLPIVTGSSSRCDNATVKLPCALVKYFPNLNLSATISGNFLVNERNPVTQIGDKILPVMMERVIENHTSFYPDTPEMHFQRDSVPKWRNLESIVPRPSVDWSLFRKFERHLSQLLNLWF